ncbi:MAG: DNA-binding protein WhiA [Oscillospiraceae bacterium]
MSFAYELKKEICSNRTLTARHKTAQAYGLLMFSKYFSADAIAIHTEHHEVAMLYEKLLLQLVNIRPEFTVKHHLKTNTEKYVVSVPNSTQRLQILDFFGIKYGQELTVKYSNFTRDGDKNAFLSGVFLACGNVTDPEKGYHFEFLVNSELLAEALQNFLIELGSEPKLTQRRGQQIVYFKDSTQIEDIITMIGATQATLSLMDTKIVKELRNNINRVTNCETANIEKTATAATNQIHQIAYIIEAGEFDSLSPELKEIALLRMENPEMSLQELGAELSTPLSRSGVNHRLQKLCKIAAEIRSEDLQ